MRRRDKLNVTPSSGNVFRDLGFSAEESEHLLVRARSAAAAPEDTRRATADPDTYQCVDDCGRSYTEHRTRMMDVSKTTTYYQVGRTEVLIPIIFDLLVDPERACRWSGPPPDRY